MTKVISLFRAAFAVLAVALIAPVFSAEPELPLRFDFGSGQVAAGHTQVLPAHVYSPEAGFGFEPGAKVTAIDRGNSDALPGDYCTSDEPFFFSVKLPEGNYRVTVTLGDSKGESTTTMKAELRRLMLENVKTAPGKIETRTVAINVRTPQIRSGGEVRLKDREKSTEMWAWDEKLTLEFSGKRPCVCGLEIAKADVPTLYLLGDSTVCDQPREPFASWGQMLTRFFQPGIAVANHAESGESLRSSLGARRLDKVLSTMRAGDWLFLQFGHNDMKAVDATAYKADLKRFVATAREKGGRVVLMTPMHRRTFDGDKIANSHREFPDAVRAAAIEVQAPLIDLHAMSQALYEAWGPEKSVQAFSTPQDGTHHNNYGSYELAKCVLEGIRQNKLELAQFLREDVPVFDPARPDPIEAFVVPASPRTPSQTPDGK